MTLLLIYFLSEYYDCNWFASNMKKLNVEYLHLSKMFSWTYFVLFKISEPTDIIVEHIRPKRAYRCVKTLESIQHICVYVAAHLYIMELKHAAYSIFIRMA